MIVYGGRQRKRVELTDELSRGGEGTVYHVRNAPDWVAKIYTQPKAAYRSKLLWMADHPPEPTTLNPAHHSIAWPVATLYSSKRGKKFVGYVMPRIRDAVLFLNVTTPKTRAALLPDFNWRYLLRTAQNLATAVGLVHSGRYVIGDLNDRNILVTPSALVTLLDTDSYQTHELSDGKDILHPCEVYTLDYTAPELQGMRLREVDRTPEQDSFGLATLIFQLLMDGSHPFRGVWNAPGEPAPPAEKIRQGWFPYLAAGNSPVLPPPRSTWDNLPPSIAELFTRCFVYGHSHPQRRPSPAEWVRALKAAEDHIESCQHGHLFSEHLLRCPICGSTSVLAMGRQIRHARQGPEAGGPGRPTLDQHEVIELPARRAPAVIDIIPATDPLPSTSLKEPATASQPLPITLQTVLRQTSASPNPPSPPAKIPIAAATPVLIGTVNSPVPTAPVSIASTLANGQQVAPQVGATVASAPPRKPFGEVSHPVDHMLDLPIKALLVLPLVVLVLLILGIAITLSATQRQPTETAAATLPAAMTEAIIAITAQTPVPTRPPQPSPLRSSPPPSATRTPVPELPVTLSPANLRSGPSIAFPIVRVLLAHTRVKPIQRLEDSTWYYVMIPDTGDQGWLSAATISPVKQLDSLPVATVLP